MHSVTLLPRWGKRGKDRHSVCVKVLLFSEPLSTLKTIAFLKNLTSEWQLCFKYSTSTIGRRGISSFFTHLPSQKYTCCINTELYITFALSKVRANRHLMLGILEKKKKKKGTENEFEYLNLLASLEQTLTGLRTNLWYVLLCRSTSLRK